MCGLSGFFRIFGSWMLALFLTVGVSACDEEDDDEDEDEDESSCELDETYHPDINPADFSTTIDNPFLPLVPGTVFTYEGGGETIVVEVTDETREVMGVTCVVVRDTVRVDGEIVEDTYDWFAQDLAGNVWYFGEDTQEFEDGEVSTEGSWEAGVSGAQPGIVMPAAPMPGHVYRQEYLACEAEDMGEVIALNEDVSVPADEYTGCVRTRDYTPLDADSNEYKWYCPDVGMVAEVDIFTGIRVELVSVE